MKDFSIEMLCLEKADNKVDRRKERSYFVYMYLLVFRAT